MTTIKAYDPTVSVAVDAERDSEFKSVCLITGAALILRLLVAVIAHGHSDVVGILWPRGIEPLGIAKSLLDGRGFSSPFALPTGPTAFVTPIYPVMLAIVESFLGVASKTSAWAILAVQSTFSALTCAAVYCVAREFFDQRTGRLAAWAWALFPYAVLLPTNIIWESCLSALMMATGLLILLRTLKSQSALQWAALGAYFSFACLVNAAFLSLLPVLLLYIFFRMPEHRRRAVWCAAIFVTCLLPWTVRNYFVFHQFVPLRDNFSLELWIGNRDGATTEFTPEIHPAFSRSEIEEYQRLGELAYMAQKRDIALKFIREKPSVFVRNTLERIATYWTFNLHGLWLLVPVLSAAGLAGMWRLFRASHPLTWMIFIPLLVYPLPYYVTHPDLRYLHPVQPLLVILAAYAATNFSHRRLKLARETLTEHPATKL